MYLQYYRHNSIRLLSQSLDQSLECKIVVTSICLSHSSSIHTSLTIPRLDALSEGLTCQTVDVPFLTEGVIPRQDHTSSRTPG